MVQINLFIDSSEFRFAAVRSQGPGGQNVNKVSSAAILYWSYLDSRFLSEEQKLQVQQKLKGWINKKDEIYIRAEETRDLERNKARCIEKLEVLLKKALFVPKKRRPTKPTRASREKRLDSKQRRSAVKSARGKVKYE
jgi:ribosome-associated protein